MVMPRGVEQLPQSIAPKKQEGKLKKVAGAPAGKLLLLPHEKARQDAEMQQMADALVDVMKKADEKPAFEKSADALGDQMFGELQTKFKHNLEKATDEEIETGIDKIRLHLERKMVGEAKQRGILHAEREIRNRLDKAEKMTRQSVGFTDLNLPRYAQRPFVEEQPMVSKKDAFENKKRAVAYLQRAMEIWGEDLAHVPAFVRDYDPTLQTSFKQMKVLEMRLRDLPKNEVALNVMMRDNPFAHSLYPEEARKRWTMFQSDLTQQLKIARDPSRHREVIGWALGRYQELLSQGKTFLKETNYEQLETLIRNPNFQAEFVKEFKETRE